VATQLQPASESVKTNLRHYIGGQWVEPEGDETIDVRNPATEELIARVPRATVGEAVRAIEAAREAFDNGPWPRLTGKERARVMRQFAAGLRLHRDEIAAIVIEQGGCTVAQTRAMQVDDAINLMDRYAELALRNPVESTSLAGGPLSAAELSTDATLAATMVVREPAGVVAAITPFNYPFLLNLQKLGPALAAGCTVVLKPTEYICLDAVVIARILDEETDLPKGAFNLLLGGMGDVGETLCSHPLVDQVTFTGSTVTGQRIMRAASDTVKRVTLELGGKSANIIFADADLDRALTGDCGLVVRHCGQGCGNWTRVLVEESIHDEVLARMLERARTIAIGDPSDPRTEMGPLVNQAQWDRVAGYIQSALAEGATLAYGGKRPDGFPKGFYMEPTVFTDVTNDMKIAQEEVFGPVVTVTKFRTEEEAIAIANDSIFGLNGAVWTSDLKRGLHVAGRIRTGMINVNGRGDGTLEYPYGGYKQSGLGREFGEWGYLEYTELKTIRFNA
jgi:aldehyde dehydrogenase (NAD+)